MEYSSLQTQSLKSFVWGDKVQRVLSAALQAVDPFEAVASHLKIDGEILSAAGKRYDLASLGKIYLIGAGKAGAPMSRAVDSQLGDRLSMGIVVVKGGYEGQTDHQPGNRIAIASAGHPIPDERGLQATQKIFELLEQTQPDDLVIGLISGGGSALLTNPSPGVSLEDLQELTQALLASGASIDEINILRKHLDQAKGGNLARLASPARVLTLILSDVVGNRLDIIASGPTVPDPSTFSDAMQILQQYNLTKEIPTSISKHIEHGIQGSKQETPKPGDPVFDRVQNIIVASNLQAVEAAVRQAKNEGYHTLLLTSYLQGEARQAGRVFAAIARQIDATGQPVPRPACVVAGGETTVTLQGDGLGGRNLELALGAVEELDGIADAVLITLASDGGDGPTDAAGAVVTGDTLSRAHTMGMQPIDYLKGNDSYHFFEPLEDLLRTGPTQTNVNDLTFLFLN